MQQRPVSLTIIGWFLIVTSGLGLLFLPMAFNNPMATRMYAQSPLPMSAHLAIGAIGGLINIACGFGILKGVNWSRFAYIGWSLVGTAISLATLPATSFALLGLVFLAVIAFFLFRPAANAWFNRAAAAEG
jgi:cbb3-type cytochrome oxidase subunit 3